MDWLRACIRRRCEVIQWGAMFRISKVEEQPRTVITVAGQLTADYIGVVEACCDQVISTGRPTDILLRDVTAIDQAGRALLRRLAARGVRLLASGIYTAYLVQELTTIRGGEG